MSIGIILKYASALKWKKFCHKKSL